MNFVKLFTCSFLLLILNSIHAQVGIGTTTPAVSAALDVTSTSKGFLPPRMTKAQRNSIANPTAGLMIWCSNCGDFGQIQVFNGFMWTNMIGGPRVDSLMVGYDYGGGKIAYIFQPGDPGYVTGEMHGLIAAPSDINTALEWGCPGTLIGGTSTGLNTGNANTLAIINGCSNSGIAARICNNLVLNGYDDWYLPSKDELDKLCLNRIAIGGFVLDGFYLSSSEYDNNNIWIQLFALIPQQAYLEKVWYNLVRPVRSF